MSLFNQRKSRNRATVNHMGAPAYHYPDEYRLVSVLLTSFVQDSYYRSADQGMADLEAALARVDAQFAAKAAVYARRAFGMRSVSHLMAALLAERASETSWGASFYDQVVVRVDDMLEILAAYRQRYGDRRAPTNAMKKGFSRAFDRFDGYQLAKYRGEGKSVKLVDLVNLVRPVPTQKNAKALSELVAGTLRNQSTWESRISAAGQRTERAPEAKQEAWADLIREGKLGYMALLRNLRNLYEAKLSKQDFRKVIDQVADERAVRRSRQFPFRFLSAYGELTKLKGPRKKGILFERDDSRRLDQLLEALEKAVNVSVKNLPLLGGKTLILTDNSGSMRGDAGGGSAVSALSRRTTADIANLFAVLYWTRAYNTYVGLFGDRLINGEMDRTRGVFENFRTLNRQAQSCGGATETGIFDAFERLIEQREMVDRIVIFSDLQIGKGCRWYTGDGRRGGDFNKLYEAYRKINPEVKVFSVDLRGYGTTVFRVGEYKLAGWSEKIFDIMERCERDPKALITEIRSLEW
ncbi:TROVE domain-containing protein [Lewinella sp. W8]|uniref:TROVE domain-containing protein n=1 Tax=Lewinella sp. W8 TaxID=2528208 RepID=UPI0010687CB0|nr:TROVE domain-containing protein [Lewinella sp. W8]MTB50453.1 TROVE domain-containing protein [Lewinella sp. W8]